MLKVDNRKISCYIYFGKLINAKGDINVKNLLFEPEQWWLDEKISSGKGKIVKIAGFDGKETSAWQIADWDWSFTALRAEMQLEPNTEYIFDFWLNGGENKNGDETCGLEIWFGDDWDGRLVFKLNRNYLLPALVKNGWYLFAVPFRTPDDAKTTLRFNAMGAVTTLAHAAPVCEYEYVTGDDLSPDAPYRPNVVFENGYPPDEDNCVQIKLFGKNFKAAERSVKRSAKVAGGVMAALLLIAGIFKFKKNKKK